MARRGGDARGNNRDRAARKLRLLREFGNGMKAPCSFCGAYVTFETMHVDRYPIPGAAGGRYVRGNVRPSCGPCNLEDGGRLGAARAKLVLATE
jgi:hypothetical protein